MCTRTVQQVLEAAQAEPSWLSCDAGLIEAAVPLRAGGQTFGFLLFNGFFTELPCPLTINRLRHRLARLQLSNTGPELEALCSETPLMPLQRVQALCRLLSLAASHLVLSITDNLATPESKLPDLISKACAMIRKSFTHELSLSELSKSLKVSPEHLCRLFHHSTGLHYREYVARLRAEHARNKLTSSTQRIADIAFASGFQSLSQFNRRFKAIYGVSPQQLRSASQRLAQRD
jgi:AraC-like DNA-binding protein